jgi:hypothetical protein
MKPKKKQKLPDVSGTSVGVHEDGVRRFVQCTKCERTVLFHGMPTMWSLGWGSHLNGKVRVWECSSCWAGGPKAPDEPPSYRVDEYMLEVATKKNKIRNRLEKQILLLLEVERARGETFLRAIVAHVKAHRGHRADRWVHLLELLPILPKGGGKAARKQGTGKRSYHPVPKIRRVAEEPATEVVAVRLTASEKRRGEELAAKTSANGKVGLLLRSFLQSALGGALQPAQARSAETLDRSTDAGDPSTRGGDPSTEGPEQWRVAGR